MKCSAIIKMGFIIIWLFLYTYPAQNLSKKSESDSSQHEYVMQDTFSITNHKIVLNGVPLSYKATAGLMRINDSTGSVVASIFFTAYTCQVANSVNSRPITFAFNGGPGASSMYLHLGAAGPKSVPIGSNGVELPATDTLIENQNTWLPFTDLVFVDPVGTGYSRAGPKVNPNKFYNMEGDVEIAAEFIRLYLTKFLRWTSPLFIAGESYGTTRAATLADYLQNIKAIVPRGLILLSSALDFRMISFDSGNNLPFVLILPSYTATAWYHKRLGPDMNKLDLNPLVESSVKWAGAFYMPYLYGALQTVTSSQAGIIDSLAAYSGLSTGFIKQNGMRIDRILFAHQLLADSNKTLGILDSRVTAVRNSLQNPYDYNDPSLFIVSGPYTALINDYLRNELAYKTSMEYVYLSEEINRSWQWSTPHSQGYVNTADDLREAMNINSKLRVFAGMGFYDLTTPFLSQLYVFEHLSPDKKLTGRIVTKSYRSGHQIYTSPREAQKLTGDIKTFVEGK